MKETERIFVSPAKAAALTGLSEYSLRLGCHNGTVPHIRVGRLFKIDLPKLLEALHEQSCEGLRG
jgi:hypothetical protein